MLPVSDGARRARSWPRTRRARSTTATSGTEHILLGLLRGEDGTATIALASLGVTYDRVRTAVVRMMGLGVEPDTGELPLTGPAETVVERAGREASVRGDERVGTDHILIALIFERLAGRVPDPAAARR